VTSIVSLKSGMAYIASAYSGPSQEPTEEIVEDDISARHLSPLGAIETQNQLWLKVIIREVQSTDGKKRKMLK